MFSILQAKQLTKRFNSFCAVDQIDFEMQRGHCLGFLGPNGAGKTTTIKMIYGGLEPTSGSLQIFGLPINENRRAIKERIGVVSQKDILEETLSAWDNLKIHGRHFGLNAHTIQERSAALLKLLQLEERAREPIFHLSGGMKRRLSIAKGLINHPELLLLDEPTTGFDPQARLLLWEKIREIKAGGTSILLTTHYMHEAESLCDAVIIIDHGKIIERGIPREMVLKYACQNLEEVFLKLTGRELRD